MAYKAQIDVAVTGLDQVKQLAADVKTISGNVNKINGGKGSKSSKGNAKEELLTHTKLNNVLNSNAIQYGRALKLKRKGIDLTEQEATYNRAIELAVKGRVKEAKELISFSRLTNTESQNELLSKQEALKAEKKTVRVTRERAEHIEALEKAQAKNFNLRSRIDALDRKGVNVDKLRAKYGELNSAQGKRNFGTFRKLSRALDLNLKKETLKLRILTKQNKERLKETNFLKRMGGARSPIRGDAIRDVGSPAFNERAARMGGPRSALNYQRGQLRPGPRGTGAGGGSVLQSAAISGAFPLLFGQGPLTAAAGAVGGGLGAKFGGQMGGFAGGLAATAAVTAIQQTIAGVADLGKAFNSINPNIEKLVSTLGIAGTEEERRIKLIKETQGAQAALRAVTEEMNNKLGKKAVKDLKEFGKAAQRIGNAFTVLGAKMQAALAPFLKFFADMVANPIEAGEIKRKAAPLAKNDPQIKALRSQIEAISAQSGGGRGGAKGRMDKIKLLEKEIVLREKILAQQVTEKLRDDNIELSYEHALKSREKQNALHKAFLIGKYEETKLEQEAKEIIDELEKTYGEISDTQKQIIKDKLKGYALDKEAYDMAVKIKEAWKGISNEITGSIKDGIKGLIKGTSTWADMLNNVADKFLDMALNQAFYGSILGSGGPKGGGIFGALGLFANGGRPPVGKPSIVGEKGPELFVPSSSGRIVPNHELGKGGGSTSVVVNVDASGTEVQGDDAQAKQLGTMLSAAVQAELVKQKRPGGLLAGV